jgi:hypothetical protein
MRWFKAKRRFGAGLALCALALQLALSFAHVHLDGVRLHHTTAARGAIAQTQQLPGQQPADSGDDDYCAICATIYLAANSFVPQPPQLPVPSASQTIEHFDRVGLIFVAPRRTPFQSRAPPLA